MKEGQTVHLRFDRQPTVHCSDPLAKYPAGEYSVWLYNNPVRDRDNIKYDKQIKIASGISAKANSVDIKIPANIPKVNNKDVWYLRLDTTLVSAPQVRDIAFFTTFEENVLILFGRCLLFIMLLGLSLFTMLDLSPAWNSNLVCRSCKLVQL